MKISRIFPTPKYLKLSTVGLDISDRSVRVLGLNETRLGLEVFTYGKEFVDEGVLLQGKILNPDAFKKILIKIKSQYNIKFAHV